MPGLSAQRKAEHFGPVVLLTEEEEKKKTNQKTPPQNHHIKQVSDLTWKFCFVFLQLQNGGFAV